MQVGDRGSRARRRASLGLAAAALGVSFLTACGTTPGAASGPVASPSARGPGPADAWSTRRLTDPARVRVFDQDGQALATFTRGARTVALRGPLRVLAEPATTSATVRSDTWVRLLPRPFDGRVDRTWLARELSDTSPDVLAIAMQYVSGAPQVRNHRGLVVSGDAGFGPLLADGIRAEGSDFNDYLGISWPYGSVVDRPEAAERLMLDCSGFLRMVYGYRSGFPLGRGPSTTALPRVATVMMDQGPGTVIEPNRGVTPSTRRLQPGDLLFFDNTEGDGVPFNHSGIYLGRDNRGAPRFVSSRALADGPSMGDAGGRSVLTGPGIYAESWRSARRI